MMIRSTGWVFSVDVGPARPFGHRARLTASAHCASVPKLRRNSGIDMPC
jgi:hypothetical protein